jgi:hypothetical protein
MEPMFDLPALRRPSRPARQSTIDSSGAIALDAGYVYWTEEGTFSYGIDTSPGSVKRISQ